MSELPLKWAVGDRCEVDGEVGVVESVLPEATWITVRLPDGRLFGRPIREAKIPADAGTRKYGTA